MPFLFLNPDHKYYFHKYSKVFLLNLEACLCLCLKTMEQLKLLINYQIISGHHCKSSPDEHSQKADGLFKYLDLSGFFQFLVKYRYRKKLSSTININCHTEVVTYA